MPRLRPQPQFYSGLRPQPPAQRKMTTAQPVCASDMPRLSPHPPAQRLPEGFVTMRELIIREKARNSSRPQSVQLPPISGSSRPRGLYPHTLAQRKTKTSVEYMERKVCEPEEEEEYSDEQDKLKEQQYQDEMKKMKKEVDCITEKIDHLRKEELKMTKLIEQKQKQRRQLVDRPKPDRIARK
ncbi:uncharacterized protein LOC143712177 [Siphateles boraxobius]|uniref:uncharacterized protein LOC143712177 n=1 Tax=Siphateles boraxobius TaxID=180520 RepID=UPI0040632604